MTAGAPEFMRWAELAAHLQQECERVLLTFCQWVEGEIDELEEAGPLSAKHKKIRKLLEQRAAQHWWCPAFHQAQCHCNFSMGGPDTWAQESDLELLDAPAEPTHQSDILALSSPSSLNINH